MFGVVMFVEWHAGDVEFDVLTASVEDLPVQEVIPGVGRNPVVGKVFGS